MEYSEYIKTEPIDFVNFDIIIDTNELKDIEKYYELIEEKLKNNEYYVQNNQ